MKREDAEQKLSTPLSTGPESVQQSGPKEGGDVTDLGSTQKPTLEIEAETPLIQDKVEVLQQMENPVAKVPNQAPPEIQTLPEYPDGQLKFDNLSPKKASEVISDQITIAQGIAKEMLEVKSANPGTFNYGGKTYRVLVPKVQIPEMGVLTALDILSDTQAQEYLVRSNAIGSVIQVVV